MINRVKETILNKLIKNKRVSYIVVLVITLLICFILLEIKYPYYFLNDDNRLYWLPAFAYNFESIRMGILPQYNFHQYLGYPWLSNGQTMVLYPFGYAATFISQILFGNHFAAIDIFTILHLVAGAVSFFVLLKFLGLKDKSSFFGAITWVLNSFVIYVSTGWVFISAHAVFFPLTIYLGLKLYKKPSYKTFILLVASRTLLLFVGHPQYFVYSVIFEFLTVVLILIFTNLKQDKARLVKALKTYMVSYIFTVILSLPLLLPMFHQVSIASVRNGKLSFTEFSSWTYNIKQWISGLIYPHSLSESFNFLYVLKYASYVGYLTLFFFAISIIMYLKKGYVKKVRIQTSVFLILGCIAFLWMTSILFNQVIYLIPILNYFRWAFKIEFYVNFYLIAIASIGFNAYSNKIGKKYKRRVQNIILVVLILIQIVDFLNLYLFFPQRGFEIFKNKGLLQEPLTNKIKDGRIISFGDYESGYSMDVSDYIGADFATLHGLYHFGGYETMLSEDSARAALYLDEHSIMYLYESLWTNNRIDKLMDYFREWGVKWYVVNKESKLKEKLPFKKFYEDDKRTVYIDKQAKPFFYWKSDKSEKGINSHISVNIIRLTINTNKQDYIVINFLYNPFFKAYIDNEEVEIKKDSNGRVMLLIPKGSHSISLKYSDPYFQTGLYVSILFVLLIIIYFGRIKRKRRLESLCELKIPGKESDILFFVPHPDDEIAGCYMLIKKARKNGSRVKVVLITNGDGVGLFDIIKYKIFRYKPNYFEALAYERQNETIQALALLGIEKKDIIFLGYPDGCLKHLLKEDWNEDNPFVSKYTKKNHPFYKNSFNQNALYTGSSLVKDLETIILENGPTHIVYPNSFDRHKDHVAVNYFVKGAMSKLGITPIELTYLIHKGMWPLPVGRFTKCHLLPPKSLLRSEFEWYYLKLSNDDIKEKEKCLLMYKSQLKNFAMRKFLHSFIRQNELFAKGSDLNLGVEYGELSNINCNSDL